MIRCGPATHFPGQTRRTNRVAGEGRGPGPPSAMTEAESLPGWGHYDEGGSGHHRRVRRLRPARTRGHARGADSILPGASPPTRCASGVSARPGSPSCPRHGRGHRLSPSDIDYRANIDVMKRAGVTDLISVSACGSFRDEYYPGFFVLVDQLVTAPMPVRPPSSARAASPWCPWRIRSGRGCSSASPMRRRRRSRSALGGTLVCIEGPQFSTYAESMTYKKLGYDVIGMTAMPEAKLAREAEITYATIAMVTDYDCWHPEHDAVDVASVVAVRIRTP